MKIRIGTRKSPLALWQAHRVEALLSARDPSLEIELVEIVTKGDRFLEAPLAQVGGKGLFVKEIEERLLDGSIDLAVHSLKDLPAEPVPGLCLASIPEREDPRDAFLSGRYESVAALPRGARVGTSSLRRACQLKRLRADLEIVSIRGNVQSRLKTIEETLDGGVLALAGLKRLGLDAHVREVLSLEQMLPAVGQGALAIETRSDDTATRARVDALADPIAALTVAAERAFLARMGGSCRVPIAGHATLERGALRLRALVGESDGSRTLQFDDAGASTTLGEAEALGLRAADALIRQGGRELLAALEG